MLQASGWKLPDLSVMAVTTGPGSFTGIRVGLSYAKGLGLALEIKLIPLSTLDAMAAGIGDEREIISPMLDAKKKQLYTALYQNDPQEPIRNTDYQVIDPGPWLSSLPAGTLVAGSGVEAYRQLIAEKYQLLRMVSPNPAGPGIDGLVKLARLKFRRGEALDPGECDAFYLRPAVAEFKSQGR